MTDFRRDVPVGVPLDLSTLMEWHELPKYNGIQVSQLILTDLCEYLNEGCSKGIVGDG